MKICTARICIESAKERSLVEKQLWKRKLRIPLPILLLRFVTLYFAFRSQILVQFSKTLLSFWTFC
uniref:Uncharacterized protein n=1 Tax=Rhizophora mucronata TaxID=61149 RepID=A0A2P2ILM2_RHIMU